MFSSPEFEKRFNSFPSNYLANFNYVWNWKIKVESADNSHILDEKHQKEAFLRLSSILPKWQTYRNGKNKNTLETLREVLCNISEDYNEIRKYTLLNFNKIPHKILENIWHELGRVKENEGNKNNIGRYSVVAVTKPLLLIWGQTPAFDSFVRKNMSKDFNIPKYSCNWTFDNWITIMKKLSTLLKKNNNAIKFLEEKTTKLYGENSIIPYGRFIDIYYWEGSKSTNMDLNREIKTNFVKCPNCSADIPFGPPVDCPGCNSLVLPQIIFFVNQLKPIEELIASFEIIKSGIPRKSHKDFSEYLSLLSNILTLTDLEEKRIANIFNSKLGTKFFDKTSNDLKVIANQIIISVEELLESNKVLESIIPPKLGPFDFQLAQDEFIKAFFKPLTSKILEAYLRHKELSLNPEKYVVNNTIVIRMEYTPDKKAADDFSEFLDEVKNWIDELTEKEKVIKTKSDLLLMCPYCQSQQVLEINSYPHQTEVFCSNLVCKENWHRGSYRASILNVEQRDKRGLGKDRPTVYYIRTTSDGEEHLVSFSSLEKNLIFKQGDIIVLETEKESKGMFRKKWTGNWKEQPTIFINSTVNHFWIL